MFIIPIENKPDWSRPPLATLLLIIINVLVFVVWQGQDDAIAEQAEQHYQRAHLFEQERQLYLDYHHAIDEKRLPDDWQELKAPAQDALLESAIVWDRGFDHHLHQQQPWQQASPDIAARWQQDRQQFEQLRNRISSIQGGLTPADLKPWQFITSQFLHGDVMHLLGNMAFLFLFGFTLEAVLKARWYLLFYLTSGVAAGVLHCLQEQDSWIPTIGASGAVSGLMGMYLALYGLRKIRFFYSLFFVFGEIKAPAIFIFPLWLAKELYGYFYSDDNIAYWAHIGGLLMGVALVYLSRPLYRDFKANQQHSDADRQTQQTLRQIQQARSRFDFARAASLARQLSEQRPTDPAAWQIRYELAAAQPTSKPYHETTFLLLKQFVAKETPFNVWQPVVLPLLDHYQKNASKPIALSQNICTALSHRFYQQGNSAQGIAYLQMALSHPANSKALTDLLKRVINDHQRRGDHQQARALVLLLKQRQQPAPVTSS
ncbi:rhomboid family intramembrane serine protease [Cellvibrio polysaccharolyticus]|uniref:Rhomboid family intramembrane serine protease n=1 Tax=Cellvibrio polysaccharolyticus TaxID=2082724 RepID=A0A928V028_9GAMM|nr:rhomboid family intramembrane serine protease [Cellvibrio polysaccharolyticus]MBE8716365.1 rhomboid family intramembrane serine protease [Cellvibrio polysaccharolyticus]